MSPSHSSRTPAPKKPLEDDLKDDLEKVARDALLPGLGADKARIEGRAGDTSDDTALKFNK